MKQLQIKTLFILLTLSFVLMVLDSKKVLDPVRSMTQVVAAPFSFSLYQAKRGIGDFFSFATFWKSGEERIRNLEQRNLELIVLGNRAKDLERENEELRKQLAVSSQRLADRQLLPATVLGVGRYLEIDMGRQAGVKEGNTVVYLGNLVGKIVGLTDQASFIQLPTDSSSKIPVKIGRIFGLATGQFNGAIVLDRVTQNEEINVSDLIVTSGEGESYLPNLVVGKVKKIVSQETDLFKKAEVEHLIDYDKLTTVFVVLK